MENTDDVPVLDPPAFEPPPDMRRAYLDRHRAQIGELRAAAAADRWKDVLDEVSHVRGSGGMFGFAALSDAADALVRAYDDAPDDRPRLLDAYVRTLDESYV